MPREGVPPADGVVERRTFFREVPPFLTPFFPVVAVTFRFNLHPQNFQKLGKISCHPRRIARRYASIPQPLETPVVVGNFPIALGTSIQWPIPEVDHPAAWLFLGVGIWGLPTVIW